MNNRERAIRDITCAEKQAPHPQKERQSFQKFGVDVFNFKAQKEYLSQAVLRDLTKAAAMEGELTRELADSVAQGLMKWALSKGATHFCHWFQPLTDLTAEKHDAFFNPTSEGSAITEFSGDLLIRGEPDASSFPSGGLRTTFEARGYTSWDPSSPPFIIGRTLVIPTIFMSWIGDALDKKTPLLRSMDALNQQALRLLRLFGDKETKRVTTTVGAEQEYFLIDTYFYNLRPDLISCGRTLFGARPPKGQELEDQYLGAIPDRIISVMEGCEFELMKLGVPIKTRHNEVAPSQYELALTFESANLAADHHMLVMDILEKVATKHGMTVLFHEKPFANINGSGKHTNWSLATDRGQNLLDPGDTPHENAQFLIFCAAVLRAVHKYAKQLRMSIATPGNDHRLGLHEAPPAIISVFLGEQLKEIFDQLESGKAGSSRRGGDLEIGVSMLPKIPRHSSDRNRTSPFAFTGNKFEFRAVGSAENIAKSVTVINTIVAESFDYISTELEQALQNKQNFNEALQKLLSELTKSFRPIIFEGDNYTADWTKEATKRGLPNLTNTVDAATVYTQSETVALFTKYQVYSRRELASRQEITLSKYIKKCMIEARCASNIAHTMILPACMTYVREVGEALNYLPAGENDFMKGISKEISSVRKVLKLLDDHIAKVPIGDLEEYACHVRDKIRPTMNEMRRSVDLLEGMIADQHWPLPKYREMLFIR